MRKHPAVGMRARDLGELYTYLKLFGRVYTDCEAERQIIEHGIEGIFSREYSSEDASTALQAMKNPRKAGRRRKNGPEAQEQIKALSAQGKTIRGYPLKRVFPEALCRG